MEIDERQIDYQSSLCGAETETKNKRHKNMKTNIMKVTGVAFAALVLAATSLYAQPGPRPLQHITTQDQVSALQAGSTVVMTCAKCKTVQVAKVDQKQGILGWSQPKTEHLCPGCGGKIKVTQVAGKGTTRASYVHTCSKCGSESAFCCGGTGMKM